MRFSTQAAIIAISSQKSSILFECNSVALMLSTSGKFFYAVQAVLRILSFVAKPLVTAILLQKNENFDELAIRSRLFPF